IIHRGLATLNARTEAGAETIPANPDAPPGSPQSRPTPPTGECCKAAPPILEFDAKGNLIKAWGGESGEGYTWPQSNHGISIDDKDNVWIGGNGQRDSHILKFTRDGRFLQQIGIPGRTANSNSTEHF